MFEPNSKFYTVSTVLVHKYGVENVTVKNCMSHFSMFFSTKANLKLANGNTGHFQGIGIILCRFTKCYIIYPAGPVYYYPGHPSTTISSVELKFYFGFQKVKSEPFNTVTSLILKVVIGYHPTRLKTIYNIFKYKFSNSTFK